MRSHSARSEFQLRTVFGVEYEPTNKGGVDTHQSQTKELPKREQQKSVGIVCYFFNYYVYYTNQCNICGRSSNKPPPGAVNLERSYQICQAVIQNSPNRDQLRCQLKPPPSLLAAAQANNMKKNENR